MFNSQYHVWGMFHHICIASSKFLPSFLWFCHNMMKCPAGACWSHQELASSEASCREVDDEDDGLALRLQRGVRCHSDSLCLVETCVIWIMSSCLEVRKAARPSMSRQTSDDMESVVEEEICARDSPEISQRFKWRFCWRWSDIF